MPSSSQPISIPYQEAIISSISATLPTPTPIDHYTITMRCLSNIYNSALDTPQERTKKRFAVGTPYRRGPEVLDLIGPRGYLGIILGLALLVYYMWSNLK
ncbi:hypothetical protein BJX70DRAFT_352371 [Aspergillus crustosus]